MEQRYTRGDTLTVRASGDSEEIAGVDSLLAINDELRRALDVALAQIDAEHDLTKALLIKMRRYFVSHGLLTGECVAWMQLKVRYGIGENTDADAQWLLAHERRVNVDTLPLRPKASDE